MQLESAAEQLGLHLLAPPQALSGGDIAAVCVLDTDQGWLVAKRDDAQRLAGEADGLRALAVDAGSLVVPEVVGLADDWLFMEFIERGSPQPARLGEGLRALHAVHSLEHGWEHDNACGRTPQRNAPCNDGREFQRDRRLLPLTELAGQRGLLSKTDQQQLHAVANGLESWLPNVPASLIHGDLWSGNLLYSNRGPALIDPAVYRHYPEVDLAMLTLFGAPGDDFFEAYWNGSAPDDWPRREALFQLYPLLNHLVLFGSGYRSGLLATLTRLEQF